MQGATHLKNPEFGAYLTVKSPENSMQNCINTRLAALREAHANCLIITTFQFQLFLILLQILDW